MNNILSLQFQIFNPYSKLKHAFSTRIGGVSKPPYDSLNLGLHTGDSVADVQENRALFFKYLDITTNKIVFPEQTHSVNISVVSEPGIVQNCDALITDQQNVFLSVQTADCFPVFLFDPRQMVSGLVHSGWRGTSMNIAGLTIKRMQVQFNSQPGSILAAIGPGVLQGNYQIDMPVARHFSNRYLQEDGPDHFRLDLRRVIFDQLTEAGIKQENIEVTPVCSFKEKGLFYSYRRDGHKSGRMMGIIGMTD